MGVMKQYGELLDHWYNLAEWLLENENSAGAARKKFLMLENPRADAIAQFERALTAYEDSQYH